MISSVSSGSVSAGARRVWKVCTIESSPLKHPCSNFYTSSSIYMSKINKCTSVLLFDFIVISSCIFWCWESFQRIHNRLLSAKIQHISIFRPLRQCTWPKSINATACFSLILSSSVTASFGARNISNVFAIDFPPEISHVPIFRTLH